MQKENISMRKLVDLEIRRNHLKSYHIASILCGTVLLIFHYFMAAIPLIDPFEPDIEMFSSYDFLFSLNHLLGVAAFAINGAVMGARFVVEDCSRERAILLFSYPVSRKKLLCAKLCLTFGYSVMAMLICQIVPDGVFLLTENIFPLCKGALTLQVILWNVISLIGYSLLTGILGIVAVWIGFRKKSVTVTIVSAVLAASVVCQFLSVTYIFPPMLFILLGFAVVGGVIILKDLLHQVENMEV